MSGELRDWGGGGGPRPCMRTVYAAGTPPASTEGPARVWPVTLVGRRAAQEYPSMICCLRKQSSV